METGTDEGAQRDPWRDAGTFGALCELNARFIEGEMDSSPTHGGPLDEESGPLVPYLAALNRAGFLTTDSQPGEDLGHSRQRAYVDGLTNVEMTRRIERLALVSDLYVVVVAPGASGGAMLPVTTDLFRPHSWGGFMSPDEETGVFHEVLGFEECCGPVRGLREAWSVCVIDLCWGRKEYLWRVLTDELCVKLNPHKGWVASEDWTYPEE